MSLPSVAFRIGLSALLIVSVVGCSGLGGLGGDDDTVATGGGGTGGTGGGGTSGGTGGGGTSGGGTGGTGGGGTGGGGTSTAENAQSLMLRIPDVRNISVAEQSPDAGTPVTVDVQDDPATFAVTFNEPLKKTSDGTDGSTVPASGTLTKPDPNSDEYVNGDDTRIAKVLAATDEAQSPQKFLQYAGYGEYVHLIDEGGGTTSGYVGHIYGGEGTQAMPVNIATATYSGRFIGLAVGPGDDAIGNGSGGDAANLEGNVAITANFTSGQVAGAVTDIVRSPTSADDPVATAAPYALAMTGATITGNTYGGGAVAFTDTGSGAGSVSGSTFIGGFYGPDAAETAGALRVEGTAPGTGIGTGDVHLQGSFGAQQTSTTPTP
jgi:hypothetical protein